MGQLGKRLISSAFFVSLAVGVTFFSPLWFFSLFVSMLILVSLNEFFSLAAHKGVSVNRVLALALGFLIPLCFHFFASSLGLVVVCLCLFVYRFRPSFRNEVLVSTSMILFGLIYISWFFSHLIEMRQLAGGPWWVFYTILIVKSGDAGAYFVGKRYGRTKLMAHISPNKSVEGAIGGFLTTVLLSLFSKVFLPDVGFLHFLILGILVGIVAQLGDLAESLMKRDAGVKDSGTIPGLGGVLDVLDSLLLTVPFVFYYIVTILGVGLPQ